MQNRLGFFRRHMRTFGALLFVFVYSVSISFATPPTTKYAPGETLDPSCIPGSTNCSVQILPDQAGNANKYLTTDGSVTSWSTNTLVLGGNFVTSGNYATTLTTTGTTTLTLPTSGTLATTANINTAVSGTTNYIPKFTGTNTIGNSSIYDNGTNVGIGTGSPATKLHIAGGEITVDAGNAINFNGTASGSSPYIYYNSGQNDLLIRNNVASGTLSLGATTEALRILSSGNVGVGTANPEYLLDVGNWAANVNTSTTPSLRLSGYNILNPDTLHYGSYGGIVFSTTGSYGGRTFLVTNALDTNKFAIIRSAGTAVPTLGLGGAITSGTADFVVTNTGNIGIGTTTPGYRLEVKKTSSGSALNLIGDAVGTRNDTGIDFSASNSTTISYARIGLQVTTASLGAETGGLAFSTINDGTFSEKMFIQGNGRVGIGTTAPNFQLEVAGSFGVTNGTTILRNTSASGYTTLRLYNNQDSGSRALEIDYSGSSYAGSLLSGGPTGESAAITTTGAYPLVFGTSNTARLSIDSSGNIVISDLAGVGNRCVYADASGQLNVKNDDCGLASGGDDMGDHTATQNIILGSNWLSGDGGNEGIRVDGSGNVSVKTATSLAPLTVAETSGTDAIRVTSPSHARIGLTSTAVNGDTWTMYSADNGSLQLFNQDTSTYALYSHPASSTGVFMNGSGNMGIGTTNPTNARLEVVQTAESEGLRVDGAGSGFALIVRGGNIRNASVRSGLTVGANYGATTPPDNGAIIEGNVGIGQTSPTQKLEVAGNVLIKEGINDVNLYLGNSSYGQKLEYSTGKISIRTNSADRITVDNTGNVGIATSTPHAPLEVVGRTITSNLVIGPYATLNDTTGVSGTLQFGNGNTSFVTGSADAYMYKSQSIIGTLPVGTLVSQIRSDVTGGAFAFVGGSTPTPLMTILSSGNVGIGTTSPSAKLEIQGGNINCGSSSVRCVLNLNSDTGASTYINFVSNLSGGHSYITGPDVSVIGGYSIYDATDAAARLHISSAGNVGIGVTNPVGLLSLKNQISNTSNGDNPINYAATGGSEGQAIFNSYYVVNTDGSGTYPRYLDIASVGSPDGTNGGGNIRFLTNPITLNSPAVERMRISSNGNVGVGTTTPAYKLVVSNAGANGFEVDVVSGANSGSALLSYNRNAAAYTQMSFYASNFSFTSQSSADTLRIINNGNVAIGAIDPDVVGLVVSKAPVGNGEAIYNMSLMDPAGYASRVGSGISFGGYFNATDFTYTFANIKGFKENLSNNDYAGALAFSTRINGGNPTERMRITSAGNVGIGTTTPNYRFQSNGPTGDWAGHFKGVTTTGQSYGLFIDAGTNASDSSFMVRDANANNIMRITGAGNIGIGTSTPQSKLDIAFGGYTSSGFALQIGADEGNFVTRTNNTPKLGMVVTPHYNNSEEPFGLMYGYSTATQNYLTFGSAVTAANAATEISFYTAANNTTVVGTERFKIDSSGRPFFYSLTAGTGNGYACIASSGELLYSSGGTCTPSDERLKKDIQHVGTDDTTALDLIRALNPVSFHWIETERGAKLQYGFLAQEVEAIFPDMVAHNPETALTPGNTLSIDYPQLISPAIAAIKELDIIVQALPVFENQSLAAKVAEFLRGIAERGEAVVAKLRADEVETDRICVKKSDGSHLCLTGDELQAAVNGAGSIVSGDSSGDETPAPEPAPEEGGEEPQPTEEGTNEPTPEEDNSEPVPEEQPLTEETP